jgi:hypothetical protein
VPQLDVHGMGSLADAFSPGEPGERAPVDYPPVIFINVVLSGDNAIVVGMAAAGMPRDIRPDVTFYGMLCGCARAIPAAAEIAERLPSGLGDDESVLEFDETAAWMLDCGLN